MLRIFPSESSYKNIIDKAVIFRLKTNLPTCYIAVQSKALYSLLQIVDRGLQLVGTPFWMGYRGGRTMQRSWFAFSLVILLSVFCFLQPVKAQQVTAAITGTVVDPAGAPISGATVTARDTERGTVYNTKTDDSGVFNFARMPIGNYEVRASASGFETAVQPPYTLVLNQTARIEFKMKVGAATETVEVTSETPQLQTDTTQVSTLIDSNTDQ